MAALGATISRQQLISTKSVIRSPTSNEEKTALRLRRRRCHPSPRNVMLQLVQAKCQWHHPTCARSGILRSNPSFDQPVPLEALVCRNIPVAFQTPSLSQPSTNPSIAVGISWVREQEARCPE